MMNHHGGVVLVGDHLYGFSNAILTCLEFATGKVTWHRPQRRQGLASPMPTACCTCSARTISSAWPRRIPEAYNGEGPLHHRGSGPAQLGASRGLRRQAYIRNQAC